MSKEIIKLPEEIIKAVDEMAEKRTLGYKTREEIINEAVRMKVIDLGSR